MMRSGWLAWTAFYFCGAIGPRLTSCAFARTPTRAGTDPLSVPRAERVGCCQFLLALPSMMSLHFAPSEDISYVNV